MKIQAESHLDHLSPEVLDFVVQTFGDKDGFFIETVPLPEGMTMESTLWGPVMGDEPVAESEVELCFRPGRDWPSRTCRRGTRQVTTVTVIAGPDGDESCVLYTAFGGPCTPREPGDTSLQGDEAALQESKDFWAQHALYLG